MRDALVVPGSAYTPLPRYTSALSLPREPISPSALKIAPFELTSVRITHTPQNSSVALVLAWDILLLLNFIISLLLTDIINTTPALFRFIFPRNSLCITIIKKLNLYSEISYVKEKELFLFHIYIIK